MNMVDLRNAEVCSRKPNKSNRSLLIRFFIYYIFLLFSSLAFANYPQTFVGYELVGFNIISPTLQQTCEIKRQAVAGVSCDGNAVITLCTESRVDAWGSCYGESSNFIKKIGRCSGVLSPYTGICPGNPSCSSGKAYNPQTNQCDTPPPNDAVPSSPAKTPPPSCDAGPQPGSPKPISYSTGTKVLTELDYAGKISTGIVSTEFIRHYNTQVGGGARLGKNWFWDGQAQIITPLAIPVSGTQAIVLRPEGIKLPFTYNGSQWQGDADMTDKLIELKDGNGNRTGWTYALDKNGALETYNNFGQQISLADRTGFTQSATYSTSTTPANIASLAGMLISTTNPLGHSLHFAYDISNRISIMTNPAGGAYTYAYSTEGNNNLVSVTYPDGKVKTYHYENTSYPNALTGITDENGSRYMSYTYDANGRAIDEISPTFGTNVNHYALSYTPGVSTTVTDPRGSIRTYNFTTILGVVKSTGQTQPAGAGCAASAAALTYDANGNVSSRTDFNGNKATYSYDLNRNLETLRTEGLTSAGAATAATRTIATTWHSTWNLPLLVSEYNAAAATGTPVKTTTTSYDDKGNVTSVTETDPVRNLSRTTTTTYTYSSAVPGLVLSKVVDGPRTDVNDITTYTYYPHDATCTASTAAPIVDPITGISPVNLGCRGQLLSVQNPLGQTTSYDRYNHHGQVEQMTDANGLVTTSTYDLRQRLLSKTVGTELTSLTYDNVGQVTQLTMPDNSSLNYTYDAAHRLTEVQDSLGNKIVYTLDSEGNRITEDTKDPQGNLAKTLSRSYDALNRLKTLTGIE